MPPETGMASTRFYTWRLQELIATYKQEYDDLQGPERKEVDMIVSCGIIDMNPGSVLRDRLFTLFPSGDIYEALTALLAYTPPPGP